MGITKSKQYLLTTYELQEFADQVNLSLEDVQNLYKIFQNLSSLIKDDGVIDFNEFHTGFQNKYNDSVMKIARYDQSNIHSVLNFREFIFGYATFLSSNKAAQIKYLFKLIDTTNQNQISKEKIIETLKCLLQNFPLIKLTSQEIELMIDSELELLQSLPNFTEETPKYIDYQTFYSFISENSYILEWLNFKIQ